MTTRPKIEVGIDCNDPASLAPFWAAALGYGVGKLDANGVYLPLVPPDADALPVYLQRVPEGKSVKNRLHFDLVVDDPDPLIEALVELGAERLDEPISDPEGHWWQVMVDPAGNEFCVCRNID